MSDLKMQFYRPVVTGMPGVQQNIPPQSQPSGEGKDSFRAVLEQQLSQQSNVNFSRHAVKRVVEHNLDLGPDELARLDEGMRLAEEKNLEDPLILVGGTAFVVNVPNNMVITAVNSREMKGAVFTNIDGTVIV